MQRVEEVHETLSRLLVWMPEVLGLGVIDQFLPSKVSTMAWGGVPSTGIPYQPTATQKVGEVHETPARTFISLLEGFGLGVIDQEVPLKVSTRVLPLEVPTATQKVEETHETSYRSRS
jgi:hypothetical protein